MTTDIPRDSDKGFPLCRIYTQNLTMDDIILSNHNKNVIDHIIQENKHADKLNAYGFYPKRRLLFCGPPGTGKTLTAKILSSVMSWPLVYVSFDSTVSSYLGETATNLRKIFDFIENDKFVVLFDEFDIVGKQRDDPHEHGEIKRVVNNFIQMLDTTQTNSIIIAATNHQHLLDVAVWRRFDDIIFFDRPDHSQRMLLFEKYLKALQLDQNINIKQFADITKYHSAADIAQICISAQKSAILDNNDTIKQEYIIQSITEQNNRMKYQSQSNTYHRSA